jgi:hypothetical protein
MFLAIIATLQQNPVVTQSPQQIYVTVQQPPGPPEWVKILFTAAVGAIIGVLSSLLTETLKLGLPPGLRQTVKTLFSVRCKILDRQDYCSAI